MNGFLGATLTLLIANASAQQPPPGLLPAVSVKPREPAREIDKLPPELRGHFVIAQRGMEWLRLDNQPDGKFTPGILPALAAKSDSDPLQPQIEATATLIRAAVYFKDERALVLGKQALLRMLQETMVDPRKPGLRFTSAPDLFANRLAACGGLLRAIHELPNPPADLFEQGEELANYILSRRRTDGTFEFDDEAMRANLTQSCTGPALAGLMRSDKRKDNVRLETLAKACPVHIAAWRQAKSPAMLADHAVAYADAFAQSGAVGFAQAVFELSDWALSQQIPSDPRQPLTSGGFIPWRDGKATTLPPDATSAPFVICVAAGCRAARQAGDTQRHERYRKSLDASMSFLGTLQYTESRVLHFADGFRPWVYGGFFNSHQDGNLSLQNHQQIVRALLDGLVSP